LYHPERVLGVTLISVAYGPPGLFDFDIALERYEVFGYWEFFQSNDAAKIIEDNLDSFMDLIFANDTTLWKTNFVLLGKLRAWLTNKNRTNRASYFTENDYNFMREYLSEGMQPKLNWYKTFIENNDWNDEKDLDPVIKKPFLYLGGTKDPVTVIAPDQGPNPYIEDLEIIPVNTGHWVMEEDPMAVNQHIHQWINRIIPI
jgi:pimeloyl-ACP methyl ester carboxylesterase